MFLKKATFSLIMLIEITINLNNLLYINSRLATMIKIFCISFIFELVRYLLRVLILEFDLQILSFVQIVSIEALYNMLILMVIYPLFKWAGEVTDEIYNKKEVLTRYF